MTGSTSPQKDDAVKVVNSAPANDAHKKQEPNTPPVSSDKK